MLKNYKCANFIKGNTNCELCIINRTYIDLQNTDCQSCFKPLIEIKRVK